jgi:carbamoyltransferase
MITLGINPCFTANHHDPSASLIVDGSVVVAIEEERLNRVKTSIGLFPSRAIKFCLDYVGLGIEQIDCIASPGSTTPELSEKIRCALVHDYGFSPPIKLLPHYLCHAAGAFYSSGFTDSLVVSVDGYGDKVSTWVGKGDASGFHEILKVEGGSSIGNLFAQFTEYLGFIRTEGEFKVMGMAAYGKPIYDLSEFLRANGNSYTTENKDLACAHRVTSTFEPCVNHEYLQKRGYPKRNSLTKTFTQDHFNLAASVQKAFEDAYLGMISAHRRISPRLCLSGGSALNCLANGKLLDIFEDVYVMPAASDRGLSLGAALLYCAQIGERVSPPGSMFLGGQYSDSETKDLFDRNGIAYEALEDPAARAAEDIAHGRIIGWHQGRSEFGPRALGARSILASPSRSGMKAEINRKIKFREEYRPFAPAILASAAKDFGVSRKFPFMTIATIPEAELARHIPETIHADGTARIQTIAERGEPLSELLQALKARGVFPAVINTSFNLSGEPIVETPLDAVRTFYSCGIDVLYVGSLRISKRL